jgi:alpha-beta hydrolase superfamily lysophospholipase
MMHELVHRAQVNGVELKYLEEGQGTLVLLLHGFPDTAHTWDRTIRLLADRGFRAVTLSSAVTFRPKFQPTGTIASGN